MCYHISVQRRSSLPAAMSYPTIIPLTSRKSNTPGNYRDWEGVWSVKIRIGALDAALCALAAMLCVLVFLCAPKAGAQAEHGSTAAAAPYVSADGRLDINAAPSDALELLPGIGAAKAEAILAYREAYGGFESVYELLAVPGIGAETLEGFIDYICVEVPDEDTCG